MVDRTRPRVGFALKLAMLALAGPTLSVAIAKDSPPTPAPGIAIRLAIVGVTNGFKASGRIYSGSQPEGDAAFAALARLGIKTIVSVDGTKPDLDAAHRHGLRYVHLPFGYDGIPPQRVAEFAALLDRENRPIFVHCHHGQHRGPAAVAVMCLATEGWTSQQAVDWMREAGTAADYSGLYRAAREFKLPTREQVDAVRELPEIAQTSTLVDAMVAMDTQVDLLKRSQKADWKSLPNQPDISPAQEATLLWEQLKEIARTSETAGRLADYRARLATAEQGAESLRKLLAQPADNAALNSALQRVTQSCANCHQTYRNP